MYQLSGNSVRFGSPTEVPAKAGVWGWVQTEYAARGREENSNLIYKQGRKTLVQEGI